MLYNLFYKPVLALIRIMIRVAVFIRFYDSNVIERIKRTGAKYANERVMRDIMK